MSILTINYTNMARPSLKAQRRKQIIDAAMSCVARHGIGGLTLDKVAENAGIARPLIRHNIGNREQLVIAITQHFVESSSNQMNMLKAQVSEDSPLTSAIKYLFDNKSSDTTLMLVAEALIAESANNREIAKVMHNWLMGFVNSLELLAQKEFPDSTKEMRSIVATGMTGIYFTVDSMTPIAGLSEFTDASKKAALLLLDQIEQ